MHRPARFRLATLALGLLSLGLLAPAGVSAQKTIIDVYADEAISLFDPGLYASQYGRQLAAAVPPYLQRPIDDLTPRPGAGALAMGGANVALAQGAMALGWNPAGMASLREASLCVDGFLGMSSGSASHLPDTVRVAGLGDFNVRSYRADLGTRNGFGFFGAATPLLRIGSNPVVGGIAFRDYAEVVYPQANLLTMGLFGAGGTGFPFVLGVDNSEQGAIEAFTVGLAYEPIHSPTFSLAAGASANFLIGRLRSEIQLRAAVRNFEEGRINFQRDYKGFAIETGVLATVLEQVRLGLWLKLPHTIQCLNSRLVSSPLILPDSMEVDRVHWSIADYDMEIPTFLTAGVAIGPIRGIEIAMDVNQRPWDEMTISHRDPAFAQFDPADSVKIAAGATSYHVGSRFEFPLMRGAFAKRGMRLMTLLGYHSLPLSMLEIDGEAAAPYYSGDAVKGSATSFGFSLETQADVTLHLGVELQSYEYDTWFLGDSRTNVERELGFPQPGDRLMTVSRNNRILRFSAEMRL
jgi:hypothetical protein